MIRKCSTCHEIKPLSDFAKSKGCKYGISYRCKPCQNDYNHEWKKTLRGKQSIKRYLEKNRERISESRKKKYHSDPEYRKKILERRKRNYKQYDAKKYKAHRLQIIKTVYFHYSNGTMACVCCGEKQLEFLTLDHINRNGSEERRRVKKQGNVFLEYLSKQGFPEGYQVLCYNCNCGRERNDGLCPHQQKRDEEARLTI